MGTAGQAGGMKRLTLLKSGSSQGFGAHMPDKRPEFPGSSS